MRVEKTYPGYFGTYDKFDTLREYLDRFENLFLVGRNGQHPLQQPRSLNACSHDRCR